MTVVLDASVAVKAFLAEADSPAAVSLLAAPEPLLAPALIRVEVAAAVCKQARLGTLDADGVEEALAGWDRYLARGRLTLTADTDLLTEAIDLSVRLKHPLQDCLYLALALRHHAPLVTADAVFLRRAKDHYSDLRPLAPDTGTSA